MKTSKELEERLNPENIRKAVRYLTQCLDGLQFEQALVNLTTDIYKGKPLSNSILLHELAEAEEFEKLGYYFASEELETMSYKERWAVREKRFEKFKEIKKPHFIALKTQYEYLTLIANERGYSVSMWNVLKYSPIITNSEIGKFEQQDLGINTSDGNSEEAIKFSFGLIKDEPIYAEIFLECFEKGHIKSGIYLYEKYAKEVRKLLNEGSLI